MPTVTDLDRRLLVEEELHWALGRLRFVRLAHVINEPPERLGALLDEVIGRLDRFERGLR